MIISLDFSQVIMHQICNYGFFSIAAQAIRRVYSYFRKAADGCDGKAFGFGGSLSPKSLSTILCTMKIVGKRVVDLGAGEGRVLAAALALGARSAVGYELPGNAAQKFVLDAVMKMMTSVSSEPESFNCQWNAMDIDEVNVFCFPIFKNTNPNFVFSFRTILIGI